MKTTHELHHVCLCPNIPTWHLMDRFLLHMKLETFMKNCKKIPIWIKLDKNNVPFTQKLKYVHTVDGRTKYFVDWQQYKGNQLLHFHGNNEVLNCWQWQAAQNNKENSLLCCHGSAHNIYYITDRDMCGSSTQIKLIVAFPLQKWLCQHAKVLHIVYNASYLVTSCAQHAITDIDIDIYFHPISHTCDFGNILNTYSVMYNTIIKPSLKTYITHSQYPII
jgi:hypothetical protein